MKIQQIVRDWQEATQAEVWEGVRDNFLFGFIGATLVVFIATKTDLELRYIYQLLIVLELPSLTTQTAVPGLNRDRVYSIAVNLPPIAEQKRIVEIVSSMDAVIQATEQAIAEAKVLRTTLLNQEIS